MTSVPSKWSWLSRLFHWVSVLLLLLTWTMIVMYENSDGSFFIELHKSFGVSLLFWMLARVIHRMTINAPSSSPDPVWQKAIAHLTHFALYALLFAMPIAGILMSWYGGRSVNVFGLFELPSFVAIDRGQARFFNNLHTDILWPALVMFTALHIGGALYHQFILKDNLIARMK